MIEVERVALERAIRTGSSVAGEWRICKTDGLVYWQYHHETARSLVLASHRRHDFLRVPSIFPEGEWSRCRFFCAWAKKLASPRGTELLSLARGKPDGIAYAVSAIIAYRLSPVERASWELYLAGHIEQYANGCLIALNNPSRRARYRFNQPARETEAV